VRERELVAATRSWSSATSARSVATPSATVARHELSAQNSRAPMLRCASCERRPLVAISRRKSSIGTRTTSPGTWQKHRAAPFRLLDDRLDRTNPSMPMTRPRSCLRSRTPRRSTSAPDRKIDVVQPGAGHRLGVAPLHADRFAIAEQPWRSASVSASRTRFRLHN